MDVAALRTISPCFEVLSSGTSANRRNSVVSERFPMIRDAYPRHSDPFRYWLERRWDLRAPQFTYFLLNPSIARIDDGNDRTVPKLRKITEANGGGGFELINLFATVDTNQIGLHLPTAVGDESKKWIEMVVDRSTKLILGWGDGNADDENSRGRQAAVRARAKAVWPVVRKHDLWCFAKNKSESPRQPSRPVVKDDCILIRYRPHLYP
jgi:hypothetical protein